MPPNPPVTLQNETKTSLPELNDMDIPRNGKRGRPARVGQPLLKSLSYVYRLFHCKGIVQIGID